MLKPLQPLDLAENERVVVSITQKVNGAGLGQLDADFVQGLRRRLADAVPAPGLEEVRRRLSKGPRKNNCMIPGVTQSMSCTISLLSRGFHILPTAYKQSCSILL